MANIDLIGSCAKFQALLANVKMVAPMDSAVLIQGETGTGKEVIAQAIHGASPRWQNRFVALNCAAIPEGLCWRANSSAMSAAPSRVRWRRPRDVFKWLTAERCFWMKSEIFPSSCSQNFFASFRKKEFERVGAGRTLQVDVRVIAATNLDLWSMVEERKFRADLYYRLNVFPMTLPPLRERGEDIPLLVKYFVQKFAKRQGKAIDCIPDEVMDGLKRHDWPGNIRELQNVIERGVIMTTGCVLSRQTTEHIRQETGPAPCHEYARRRPAGAYHVDAP